MDNNENVKTEKLKPGDIKTTQCPRCGIDITTTVDKYGLYSFPELCPQCGINMEFYKKNNNIEWLKKQREECVKKLKDIKEEQDQFSFWGAFIEHVKCDPICWLFYGLGALVFLVSILMCFAIDVKEGIEGMLFSLIACSIVGSIAPTIDALQQQDKVNNEKFYQDNEKKILTAQIRQLDKEIERRKQMEEKTKTTNKTSKITIKKEETNQ